MAIVISEDDARSRLGAGALQLGRVVGATLGPGERTVVTEESGRIAVSADALATATAVRLADPVAEIGAGFLRDAAARCRRTAGDGAGTTVVLAQAMVAAGLRRVAAGESPVRLRAGMDAAVETVVAELARTVEQADPATVRSVVELQVSPAQATPIMSALEHAGADGLVAIEESPVAGVDLELSESFVLPGGHASDALVTDRVSGVAELAEPWVLAYDARIRELDEMLSLLDLVHPTGRPLLIVADHVDQAPLSAVVVNHLQGRQQVSVVAAPHLGTRRADRLGDVAAVTGGRLLGRETGGLRAARLEDLGSARRAVVDRDRTSLELATANASEIRHRIAGVHHALAAASGDERDWLEQRLVGLDGRHACLRVGAETPQTTGALRKRFGHAVATARAAMRHGVVPGGGAALVHAGRRLSELASTEPGAAVVEESLGAPLRRIAGNAGYDGATAHAAVTALSDAKGLDVLSGDLVDLRAAGITDPVSVPVEALRAACSAAGLLLTAAGVVVGTASSQYAAAVSRSGRDGAGHGHGHGHGQAPVPSRAQSPD